MGNAAGTVSVGVGSTNAVGGKVLLSAGSSSDTTGGHVILAGGVGTPVGSGRGGVVLDGPLFFTGTHRSVAVGVTAGSVAPINLGYLVNILEITDPVLGFGNPTTADYTLAVPGEDGRFLIIIRRSLSSVQPAVITLQGGATYSIGGGTTATIANPGDFVHLVYAAASNRWIVTSQKGTVFA